jgi:exodeoxyribonuclease-1
LNTTFYWHDYETFGVDPSKDRPSQFAGLRTDENLNVIGKPLVIYCQPQKDILPAPQACLITGITPQHALDMVCRAAVYRGHSSAVALPGHLWCRAITVSL